MTLRALERDQTLLQHKADAFRMLAEFIKTGKVAFPRLDLAYQVYVLSFKYRMSELYNVCSKFLYRRLNDMNIFDTYNVSAMVKDQTLLTQCSQYMLASSITLWTSERFSLLIPAAIRHLLSTVNGFPDESVLHAILLWCNSQESAGKIPKEELQMLMKEFLNIINALKITMTEFTSEVVPSSVFSPSVPFAMSSKLDEANISWRNTFIQHIQQCNNGQQEHLEHAQQEPELLLERNMQQLLELWGQLPSCTLDRKVLALHIKGPGFGHYLCVASDGMQENEHGEDVQVTYFTSQRSLHLERVHCAHLPECAMVADAVDHKGNMLHRSHWCRSSGLFTPPVFLSNGQTCCITLIALEKVPEKHKRKHRIEHMLKINPEKELAFTDGPLLYIWCPL